MAQVPQRPQQRPAQHTPPQQQPTRDDQRERQRDDQRERQRDDQPEPHTIGEEQMIRSREMEDKGMANWQEEHDERKTERGQRQVPGVSRTAIEDGEEWPGTPNTPPEGHDERQPGPGEPGGPTAGHYDDSDNEQGTGKRRDRDADANKDDRRR